MSPAGMKKTPLADSRRRLLSWPIARLIAAVALRGMRLSGSRTGPVDVARVNSLRIDADNVVAYAEQLRKQLVAEGKKLKKGVRAIQIGDFYGVAFERGGKAGETHLDRLLIVGADHDRRYVTELRAHFGTLPRYRKFAYAVAAGLEIHADGSSAPVLKPEATAEPSSKDAGEKKPAAADP